MYRLTFIYSLFIIKSVSRLVVYSVFTSLLYVCIYVAPVRHDISFHCITFTFTFSHLADAFIQSDLQLGST